jgi:predicted amidohydrolase
MRVAALQFDVRRGDVDRNLARVERGLHEAAALGIALVLLPEMWPTSFVELDQDADWVAASERAWECVSLLARGLGLAVAGSACAAPPPGSSASRPRNRLRLIDAGETLFAFDKVHLFSPNGEREAFSAGGEPPRTVSWRGLWVSGAVCYDLRFAPLWQAPWCAEAELLLVPAQWPSPRAAHWRALVLGRAVEHQAAVLATNRTGSEALGQRGRELVFPGNSLVVGPDGTVLAEGQGSEGLVWADLDLDRIRRLRREVPVRRDARPEVYLR